MPDQDSRPPVIESDAATAFHALTGGALLLDMRPESERLTGAPDGATPAGTDVLSTLAELGVRRDDRVYLICAQGVSSLKLARSLRERGFRGATSVEGGFSAWLEQGLPSRFPAGLDAAEAARYSRQLVLPEVGPGGQRKLSNASVLLIGAGGLGSPAALYLAAAGIGQLGIADHDRVERSNLQRQVLHDDASVGSPKAESAAARLQALNPDIEVRAIRARLDRHNVEDLLTGWDVVIDGSDNFPTRYLVNDACIRFGLPLIYGAVMRFEGQVSVFWPGAERGVNPCYRCLFPQPPTAEDAPDCATAGVLGILPGIVGTLQAAEALKIVLEIGEPLIGTLLRVDALDMRFLKSRVSADPHCVVCATGAEFPGYPDYEEFCAG